jgi:hypothetical protein
MTICDICSAISLLFGRAGIDAGSESLVCQLQSTIMQFGDLGTILWTVLISHMLLAIIVFKRQVDTVLDHQIIYLIIGYMIPFIVAILPLFFKNSAGNSIYGDTNYW